LAIFIVSNSSDEQSEAGTSTESRASGAAIEFVPLTEEEKQKVSDVILSSEFLEDIPEKYPIKITFFNFKEGERIIQDSFIINNEGIISEGKPEIKIDLHSKYISELNSENLCQIIQKANKAGDLGFSSESGKISLFLKYAGMLKHKDCLGF